MPVPTKPLLAAVPTSPIHAFPTPAHPATALPITAHPALVIHLPIVPGPTSSVPGVSADPVHANPVPTVPTIAGSEIATSTIPKTVPSNPVVIKIGPPRRVTRKEVPTPAVSKSGVTQSASFTSAVVRLTNIKSGRNPKRTYVESSSEDNDQPAYEVEGRGKGPGNRKRREPVREDGYHDPPCGRCTRAKCACFSCVKLRSRCQYSKGGLYKDESDSEEQAVGKEREENAKAKWKAKASTQRKSKDLVEDADRNAPDTPSRGLKSQVEISDDEEKIIKQPTRRRRKPAVAVATQQLPSAERMYSFHSCMSSY